MLHKARDRSAIYNKEAISSTHTPSLNITSSLTGWPCVRGPASIPNTHTCCGSRSSARARLSSADRSNAWVEQNESVVKKRFTAEVEAVYSSHRCARHHHIDHNQPTYVLPRINERWIDDSRLDNSDAWQLWGAQRVCCQ